MKTYKTKKAVLKHAKAFLEDYHNWIQGGEFFIVPEGIDKNGPEIERKLRDEGIRGAWSNKVRARENNAQCKVCVMGAINMFADSGELGREIIRELDEETEKARYKSKFHGHWNIVEIHELNDGQAHKRPENAWRATLKIINRVLEKT